MRMLPCVARASVPRSRSAPAATSVKARFSGPKTAFDGQAALGYAQAAGRLRSARARHAGAREGGGLDHRRDEEAHGQRHRAELDADDDQGREASDAQHSRAHQSVGDAARAVSHALGHAPDRGRRPEPRQARGSFDGANDGASGVGLFLALGDVLEEDAAVGRRRPPLRRRRGLGRVRRRFSSGNYPDALFGSQYFANHLPIANYKPLYGVLFDMIGDADLQIYQEANSVQNAPEVVQRVWQTAADLGYSGYFISAAGRFGDRRPPCRCRTKGLRVIDVLDIQYGPLPSSHNASTISSPNYHHTTQDTIDKVSAKSLQIVGDVAVTLVK